MSTQSHLLALAALHDSKAEALHAISLGTLAKNAPDGFFERNRDQIQAHRTVARLIRAHLTGAPSGDALAALREVTLHLAVAHSRFSPRIAESKPEAVERAIANAWKILNTHPEPVFRSDEANESAFDERP